MSKLKMSHMLITTISKPRIHYFLNPAIPNRLYARFSFPIPRQQFSSTTSNRSTKLVNFCFPDSDSDDTDDKANNAVASESNTMKKRTNLPPPYDPFNKNENPGPDDPKNLQQVFHEMRQDGLTRNAVKMFDALSKDGLTHEALELFSQIKDKGVMPDVVAHTAVIEAYADANQAKEALKVYVRMLACGVAPNAYTCTVLIKGLARSGDAKLLGEAKKCLVEMVEKKIRPNAGTLVAVLEAVEDQEGRVLVMEMRARGFVPDEKSVREALRDKKVAVSRSVMNLLFAE